MVYNQNNSQRDNDRIRYDLVERIGVIGIRDNGWTKEVNLVSWNGGIPKVDIREWDPSHVRMAKGITMVEEEAENLAKALANRYGIGVAGRPKDRRGPAARPYVQKDDADVIGFEEADRPADAGSISEAGGPAADDRKPEEAGCAEADGLAADAGQAGCEDAAEEN